jgi:hypothetical protein
LEKKIRRFRFDKFLKKIYQNREQGLTLKKSGERKKNNKKKKKKKKKREKCLIFLDLFFSPLSSFFFLLSPSTLFKSEPCRASDLKSFFPRNNNIKVPE